MVKLIANDELPYGKDVVKKNQAFEATAEDAEILIGFGHARAARKGEAAGGDLLTAAQTAAGENPPASTAGRRGRGYNRIDMRATD